MRAKEYLSQLGRANAAIRRRMKQLDDLRADISYVKGMSYEGVRVQTSPSKDNLAQKQAEEITDLEAQLTREIAKYHKLRHKITKQIEQLTDMRYQEILIMRYVEEKSLKEISAEKGYSYDWIKHQHGIALITFQNCLKHK